MGSNAYIVKYLLMLAVVPVSVAMRILGAFACRFVAELRGAAHFNWPALLNSMGWALLARTSAIYFEGGERASIMAVIVLAVMSCPVFFLALILWISTDCARLSVNHGVRFAVAARFLTLKVRREHLLFAFARNCGGFLISLLPILASGEYQIQVGLLMATFTCRLCLQTYYNCWRFRVFNIVGPVMCVCGRAMLLLFGFAMHVAKRQSSVSETSIGVYIVLVDVITLLVLIAAAGCSLASHLFSNASDS
ncbi:unnamed protein product, partial [Prorocentrum cordatum]